MTTKRTWKKLVTEAQLEILERGSYWEGQVDFSAAATKAQAETVAISPEESQKMIDKPRLLSSVPKTPVTNEKTQDAILRLFSEDKGKVLALNFASAKNPGGGFVKGSVAQEEDLCRSSALYPCLTTPTAAAYYEKNKEVIEGRTNQHGTYTDWMIYSPQVPFFRDGNGLLVSEVAYADIITCPAPNFIMSFLSVEAVKIDLNNAVEDHDAYEKIFSKRILKVIAAAEQLSDAKHLILGAFGCGVFGNDPETVSRLFHENIVGSDFDSITFAVYDPDGDSNYPVFKKAFDPPSD